MVPLPECEKHARPAEKCVGVFGVRALGLVPGGQGRRKPSARGEYASLCDVSRPAGAADDGRIEVGKGLIRSARPDAQFAPEGEEPAVVRVEAEAPLDVGERPLEVADAEAEAGPRQ